MSYTVSISNQPNNSLGACWLCKFEDDFSGELLDKCLYPKSDGSAYNALMSFFADYVKDDEIYVTGIYVLDDARDDMELMAFAQTYKSRFGVEYRDMHTALHHILAYDNEEDAHAAAILLEENGDDPAAVDEAMRKATDNYEINFRDVEDYILENGEAWRYWEDDQYGILIVNFNIPDIYY